MITTNSSLHRTGRTKTKTAESHLNATKYRLQAAITLNSTCTRHSTFSHHLILEQKRLARGGRASFKDCDWERNNWLSLRVKKCSQQPWPLPTPPHPPRIRQPENQLRRPRRNTNVNSVIVLSAGASTAVGTSDRVSLKILLLRGADVYCLGWWGHTDFQIANNAFMQTPKNDHSSVPSAAVPSSVVISSCAMIGLYMQKMVAFLSFPRVEKEAAPSRRQQRDHLSHRSMLIQAHWSRLRQAVMVWSILKLPPC